MPASAGKISALPGGVAQLGERRVRNAKVEGSIPFHSTISLTGRARSHAGAARADAVHAAGSRAVGHAFLSQASLFFGTRQGVAAARIAAARAGCGAAGAD